MPEAFTLVFKDALLVGVGGFAGAISRYLVGIGAAHWVGGRFPWSTLTVNVVGSFGLAVLMTMAVASTTAVPKHVQLAIGTGFFGAFTTFSTFSLETMRLVDLGPGDAALNVGLNVVLCLAAAFCGGLLGRALS